MVNDIRVSTDLPGHRKYKALRRTIGESPMEYLVCFWLAVAKQCPNGVLAGWTAADIEDAAGWSGEPGVLFNAMLSTEGKGSFIDVVDGCFYPHDWQDHQPWVIGAPARSDAARNAAQKRWASKPDAKRMPSASGEQCGFDAPSPSPSPSPSPIPLPKSKKEPKTCALPPDGVTPTTWADFQALRKAKRAPLTVTALDGIRSEAGKAGLSLEVVLAMCCKRGWQSFEAAWHKGEASQIPHAQQKTQKEIEEDEIYRKALKREGIDV